MKSLVVQGSTLQDTLYEFLIQMETVSHTENASLSYKFEDLRTLLEKHIGDLQKPAIIQPTVEIVNVSEKSVAKRRRRKCSKIIT